MPKDGISRFLELQPTIIFFESSRHERLKPAGVCRPRDDFLSSLMPSLRVVYTSGHRASRLLAHRMLHTVEITNIATPSTYNPPGHVQTEPTAHVEHLCANFDMFPEQLPSFVHYWGIIPSSVRFLHINGTFPPLSAYSQMLASLPAVAGLEWSAKRRSKAFPRIQGFVTPSYNYFQSAVKECSESCKTLSTIVFITGTGAREVWRAGGTLRRWERIEEHQSRLTVQDGSGKRWHLADSEGAVWRPRPFTLTLPTSLIHPSHSHSST